MKIAVVGNYKWPHYQQALLEGLQNIDSVEAFPIKIDYYPSWNIVKIIQNTKKLLNAISQLRPNVVFMYRVDFVLPCALKQIKTKYGAKILIYHNDDPYRNGIRRRMKHWCFLKSIKYGDITYVYREINIDEAQQWGGKNVKMMRSHYYSKLDYSPSDSIEINKKEKRVVFIGHFENDSRIRYIDALFKAGINLHIYGKKGWQDLFMKKGWPMENLHDPVYNEEYRKHLSSSYAALDFFSERNRDDYTRRCFEIPMAKTVLIAPSNNYMKETFTDGVNAILFNDERELVEKIKNILSDSTMTEQITMAGYEFVINGGFSEKDVAKMVVNDVNALLK